MLTFRIAITAAVMAFITALTASLVFTELGTFHAVARAAASAAMDAASASTLSRLEVEVSGLSSVVDVLSSNPLSPTPMTGARKIVRSSSSKLLCTSCRRRIASISGTKTVAGFKSGASMSWAQWSAKS